MAQYRAGPGPGLFGSHTQSPNYPYIDVGNALDGLASGASSLIRNVYLQKRQAQLDEQQRGQVEYQRGRDALMDQRYTDEQTYKRGIDQRNFNAEQLKSGITPAHQEQQPSVNMVPGAGADVQIDQLRPIQRAMLPGRLGVPGPQLTPSSADPASQALAQSVARPDVPQAGPTHLRLAQPVASTKAVDVPASYSYDNSLKGRQESAHRDRLFAAAKGAGASDADATLVAADPALARNVLRPEPKTPHVVQDESGRFHVVDPVAGTSRPVTTAGGKPLVGKPPTAAGEHYVFPVGADAEGNPVIMRGNTKTGAIEPTGQAAKETGRGGGGSASLSAEDRAKMLNQAKLDHATMTAFENKVKAGKASIGTGAALAGASADSHGGVAKNMIGILGNTVTGAVDPEYQRYLTAQRSYGRIMGNLQSKRYTDHQAEIERSISGLQGNDLNGTIDYKQQLREASLADVPTGRTTSTPKSPSKSGPLGGGKGGGRGLSAPPQGTAGNDTPGNIDFSAPAAPAPAAAASNPFGDLIPARPVKKP